MTSQDLCNKLGELTFYVLAGSWPLVRRHARAEFDYFSPLQGIFGVGKYVDFQMAVAQLRPLQAKTGGLTFDLDAMISGIDERAFSSQSAWTPEMFRWRVALRMPASVSEMNGGVTICAQNLIEEISASHRYRSHLLRERAARNDQFDHAGFHAPEEEGGASGPVASAVSA